LEAICVEDVESELTRLGIKIPQGRPEALANPAPRTCNIFQATDGGLVLIDAEVSVPVAAIFLIQAQWAGVPIFRDD
jgi:hypothetical protein